MNKAEIDNGEDIYNVTPMDNLIENSDNYSKTSGILRQYYKDNWADSESFKFKVKK